MASEDKLNWTRKPALAIIGICILFFALVIGCEEEETKEEVVKSDAVVAKPESNKDVIDDSKKTKMDFYADCQIKVQNSLKNPRSFDSEIRSLKYLVKDDGNPIIGFDFYAKNSFGGEEIHQAVCEFDKDDKIISAGYK